MPENTADNKELTALIEMPQDIPRKSLTSPLSGGNVTLAINIAVYGIKVPKAVFSGYHSQQVASTSGMVRPELRPTASEAAAIP